MEDKKEVESCEHLDVISGGCLEFGECCYYDTNEECKKFCSQYFPDWK